MSHVPAAEGPRVLPGPQIREAGGGGRPFMCSLGRTIRASLGLEQLRRRGERRSKAEEKNDGERQRRGRIGGKGDKVLSDAASGLVER